jgi:integrase/recombinase XerD
MDLIMQTYLDQFTISMDLRGYAEATKRSYLNNLKFFFRFIDKDAKDSDYKDVRRYLHYLIKERRLSAEYLNSVYSAIKFFYETTLCRDWNMKHIPRIKKHPPLPTVLSVQEVKRLLEVTENLKHRALLSTAYSAGLRVNEVTHLRIKDIDSTNMRIHIRRGKGGKPRTTILSTANLLLLRQYWRVYRPVEWLFPGTALGMPICNETAWKVYHLMSKKAGIQDAGSMHTLRHSFATHLLNDGENLNTIRELLGHKSLTTTSKYLHMTDSKISHLKSPLDSWKPEREVGYES